MEFFRRVPPHVLLILCVFFWAGNAIAGKIATGHIPAFTLSFWRWVLALLIVLPLGFRAVQRQLGLYRRHWKLMCVLAFLSVTVYNTLQYWALNWTSALNVGIVSASLPVMILLMTTSMGHERANLFQYVGVVVATCGVLVVIGRADPLVLMNLDINLGDGLILVAVIGWAIYSTLLRRLPQGVDPLGLLTVQILLGLVGIVPFYGWDLMHGRGFELTPAVALILLYVSVFASVLAYVFWNQAVRMGGANLAGIFVNLHPLFVAAMAIMFLDERLRGFHLLGLTLIFGGIYTATVLARR